MSKIRFWGLIALVLGVIFICNYIFLLGSEHKQNQIIKENSNALSGASEGESRYRNCNNTGWVYDFGTQRCINPKGSGRN